MKLVFKISIEKKWVNVGPLMVYENGFSLSLARIKDTLNIKRFKKCLNRNWEW